MIYNKINKYKNVKNAATQGMGCVFKKSRVNGNSPRNIRYIGSFFYTTEQRVELVKALRVVDEVIVYQDIYETIQKVDFDIFAIGGDQKHEGFMKAVEWCNVNDQAVVRLERTPGICSSSIKAKIFTRGEDKLWNIYFLL